MATSPSDAEHFQISSRDLSTWEAEGILSPAQVALIRARLAAHHPQIHALEHEPAPNSLSFANVVTFVGGFLILLAYTIFMGLNWADLNRPAQTLVAGGSMMGLWSLGGYLLRRDFRNAGAVLILAGTAIVPLLVYTVQRGVGLWPDSDPRTDSYAAFYRYVAATWLTMELISISVGLVVFLRTRIPLHTLPIAFWSWYLTMDLSRAVRTASGWDWQTSEHIIGAALSLVIIGLGVTAGTIGLSAYRFWPMLFGAIALFGHMTTIRFTHHDDLWSVPVYVLFFLGMFAGGIMWRSRTLVAIGAIAGYIFVGDLAFDVFADSLGFPFILAAIGLSMVMGAVYYQREIEPRLSHRFAPPENPIPAG